MASIKSVLPHTNYVSRKEEEQPIPKYYCETCDKCKDNRCDTFNRYVDPEYNKCFYHTYYKPIPVVFKPSIDLKESAIIA
jgi:hypothetical protein